MSPNRRAFPSISGLRIGGGKNVVITEVTRPCSCTQLDLATKTTLFAGASLRVRGSVDTINRRGVFETAIALTYQIEGTNRPYTIPIPITMVIKPSVVVSQEVLSIDRDSWTTLKPQAWNCTIFPYSGNRAIGSVHPLRGGRLSVGPRNLGFSSEDQVGSTIRSRRIVAPGWQTLDRVHDLGLHGAEVPFTRRP